VTKKASKTKKQPAAKQEEPEKSEPEEAVSKATTSNPEEEVKADGYSYFC